MVTEPRLLGERYSLGGILGYGGMAEVHRAMDTRLGREVAIKTLRADLARDPSFQARFRREAQSAASLNHPAIVAVYDTGEEQRGPSERVPFIVMEYVEGRTLRDVLNTERRLPWGQALGITSKICQALDYSHRQGIVHRDIKPANVMLTADGDAVKVMDFGIARAVTASSATMTQTAAVMGTAQYLSPEQARGEPVDARSDVYSTGCLVYELVTGTPPFTGDSPVAVAYQHVREEPVPPSQVISGLPPAVDAIILKAMAKNPANRYQSSAEMGRDCERALAGTPVVATPLDAPTMAMGSAPVDDGTTVLLRETAREEPRRRGLGYLLLALACLAVLIGAALVARTLFAGNRTVAVPDLKGNSVAAAQAKLAQQELRLGSQRSQQSSTKAGLIISQAPAAASDAEKDSAVNIVLSAGPGAVEVPDVTQLSVEAAVATLEARRLEVGTQTPRASNFPAGTVLAQSPASGEVPAGTKVNLTVASGKGTVPSVLGLSASAAQAALNRAGFGVNSSGRVTSQHPAGRVYRQEPAAGRALDIGEQVTITIAIAPVFTPTPTPSVTPSESPTPTVTPTTPSATPTTSSATPSSAATPTATSPSPPPV